MEAKAKDFVIETKAKESRVNKLDMPECQPASTLLPLSSRECTIASASIWNVAVAVDTDRAQLTEGIEATWLKTLRLFHLFVWRSCSLLTLCHHNQFVDEGDDDDDDSLIPLNSEHVCIGVWYRWACPHQQVSVSVDAQITDKRHWEGKSECRQSAYQQWAVDVDADLLHP